MAEESVEDCNPIDGCHTAEYSSGKVAEEVAEVGEEDGWGVEIRIGRPNLVPVISETLSEPDWKS